MKGKYLAIALSLIIIAMVITLGRVFLINSIEVVFAREPSFTNEKEIIDASELELESNIFLVDESELKENVKNHYAGNSVQVQNVERVFPNKVIIHVKEMYPILLIPYASGGFIPTDKDMQLVTPVEKAPETGNYIKIIGIEVQSNFNTRDFNQLHLILNGFIQKDLTEEGIAKFLKEIKVTDEEFILVTRSGDGVMKISRANEEELITRVGNAYEEYLGLLSRGEELNFTIAK